MAHTHAQFSSVAALPASDWLKQVCPANQKQAAKQAGPVLACLALADVRGKGRMNEDNRRNIAPGFYIWLHSNWDLIRYPESMFVFLSRWSHMESSGIVQTLLHTRISVYDAL